VHCFYGLLSGCYDRCAGTPSGKTIARDFPFVVEIAVPPGGLGKRLNDMHVAFRWRTYGIDTKTMAITFCGALLAVQSRKSSPLNLVARWWDKKRSQPAAHGDDARVTGRPFA
jgi:hypothetical protein